LSGSVPQHLVSGSKEGRGAETCVEPNISNSPCSLPTFQDGGVVHGKGSSPEGRFHAQNRSERGILSSPNLQKTSKISAFHMGGNALRVHGLALRPGRGSKVVHQNYEASSGAAEKIRDSSDYLLGRHSPHSRQHREAGNSQGFYHLPTSEIGVYNKLEKIQSYTIPDNRISRLSNKFRGDDVISSPTKSRSDKKGMRTDFEFEINNCKTNSKTDRETVIFNAGDLSSKSAKSFSANGSDKGVVNKEVLRARNNPISIRKRRINLVGTKINEYNGKTIVTPSPDLVITSDASNLGWGLLFSRKVQEGFGQKKKVYCT